MKRRVVCYDGRGRVTVEELNIPPIKTYEVLVKVRASLISPGTEIGMISRLRSHPRQEIKKKPFGYGNAGTVIEAGKNCVEIKEGMRVACMGPGALHSDYAVIPQNLCIPIPENISFEEVSFAHLAATALQAVRRAMLEFGENILVVGLGIIGNIIGQIASASGCHVLGTDIFPLRRKIAEKCDFDRVFSPEEDISVICRDFSRNKGIDCAFLCFGGDGTSVFQQVVHVMKRAPDTHRMGRIVIPGGCEITTRFGASLGNIDIRCSARTGPGYHDPEYEKGKDYPEVFVPWTTKRNLEEIIRTITEKQILIHPLITHQFPLLRAPEACDLIINQREKTLGVILKP